MKSNIVEFTVNEFGAVVHVKDSSSDQKFACKQHTVAARENY